MLRERRDRVEPGAAPHPERTAPRPATLSPAGVLALQRSLGNQGVGRLIARTPTQEQAMCDTIVAAAAKATFPAGLPVLLPQPADIDIDLDYPAEAYTRSADVPANPANYWRWMHWGKNSVRETEANTLGVITHELVHVKQIHGWWQDWNALDPATRDPWETYMQPMDEPGRWAGPQELEAYMTGLDFMPRLTHAEKRRMCVDPEIADNRPENRLLAFEVVVERRYIDPRLRADDSYGGLAKPLFGKQL